MICVSCGRSSRETLMQSVDALCPQLQSCVSCASKYLSEDLMYESDRQLLRNKHGLFGPLAIECRMCGENKCLWNSNGTTNLLCNDCNDERVYYMKRAGV